MIQTTGALASGKPETILRDAKSTAVLAIVLPCYRSATKIGSVLARIPPQVRHIIAVDDASPDNLRQVLDEISDPRLIVLGHDKNRGVGAAMKTGFAKALELGADVVVKVDSDGQMDPALIPELVAPILAGAADFAKGNRFADLGFVRHMPLVRRLGNLALSFLVKLASGYWGLFDPCNGYVALRASLLRSLDLSKVADGYFFEISLLCEAYLSRAVLRDVPMPAVYGDELSSLRPLKTLFEFIPRLGARVVRRVGYTYFLRDFNVVSVFITAGAPLLAFGLAWSAFYWYESSRTGILTSTGTVMVGTLSIILGFQLLLEAIVLDVQHEPGRHAL